MTTAQIDQWIADAEARCEAATSGPWKPKAHQDCPAYGVELAYDPIKASRTSGYGLGSGGRAICVLNDDEYIEYASHTEQTAVAEFIAHSRMDLPRALRLIRRYRNALTRIKDHDCTHMHEGCTCGMLDLPAVAEEALAYTGEE